MNLGGFQNNEKWIAVVPSGRPFERLSGYTFTFFSHATTFLLVAADLLAPL